MASWVAPAFYALGMTVGYIQVEMDNRTRQQMYGCDVTYGTNSEFGFDFLRDNMAVRPDTRVHRELNPVRLADVGRGEREQLDANRRGGNPVHL